MTAPIVYRGRWEQAGRRVSSQKARALSFRGVPLYVPITRDSADPRRDGESIPWQAMPGLRVVAFGRDFIFDVAEIDGGHRVIPRVPCRRLHPGTSAWEATGAVNLDGVGPCWVIEAQRPSRTDFYIRTYPGPDGRWVVDPVEVER